MNQDEPRGSKIEDAETNDSKCGHVSNNTTIFIASADSPAALVPIEQKADILKLDIDCFEELFDYLSLMQLICLSKVCKRLNQVAGYWLQENYPNLNIRGSWQNWISLQNYTKKHKLTEDCSLESFIQYAKNWHRFREIEFQGAEFRYMQWYRNGELKISKKIDKFREILSKIETLNLNKCKIDGNLHDAILDLCSNLKGLSLTYNKWYQIINSTDNNWLFRKYPTLEHFEYLGSDYDFWRLRSHHIITFLEINPNIRHLGVSEKFILENEQTIMSSNVKLDNLAIWFEIESNLGEFCGLLNRLHNRKFYGRLMMYFKKTIDHQQIDQLVSLRGLVKLYVNSICYKIFFSALRSLEEIRIPDSWNIIDIEGFATLPKLKWVSFDRCTFNEIHVLISKAVNLTKIRFTTILGRILSKEDIAILNNTREKLDGASKVTIYVEEPMYLDLKWEMKQQEFELIKLKRHASYDWYHDFRANDSVDQMPKFGF